MSMISNLRAYAERNFPADKLAEIRSATEPATALATLNGVKLTEAQFLGGMRAIEALPQDQRWDVIERAFALQDYAERAGLSPVEAVSAAIAARVTALYKWQAVHDPNLVNDPDHLLAAAAIADLMSDDGGVCFDADRYRELVEFIAQMPF